MEVRASLKGAKLGTHKGRLVANLVRDKSCAEALTILQGCPQKAARPIEKLLRSALANAEEKNARQQAGLDIDNLYVKHITVDQGPHAWRIRPRAMGRAAWVRKMSSHLTLVLGER
jgi:large subunit ribosomal protein L22